MTKYRIYNNDIIEWCKRYTKIKFHALLGDPPYHLQSIVKRFGKNGSAPAKYGSDGVFQRTSTGFMGQEWDGGEIAFNPETWAMLGEHLYDGAFGFAYAASRNWHRLAVAIEDAGFIIHPTIFCWVQGQGFPKATNISKQLEKGKKVGEKDVGPNMKKNNYSRDSGDREIADIVEFETDLGVAWQGHRYGLQALKPSVEPIICFQKPYNGKPLDNITQTGAGALNIDGARIPLLTEDDEYVINTFDDGAKPWGDAQGKKYTSRKVSKKVEPFETWIEKTKDWGGTREEWEKLRDARNVEDAERHQLGNEQEGRWPANFVLDEETGRRLDQQSGLLQSGKMLTTHERHTDGSPVGVYGKFDKNHPLQETYGDSGGASRFFYTVSYDIDEADPIFYCSKTSTTEKEAGLIGHFPCKTCGQLDSEFHIALDHRTGKEKQIKEKCRRASHPTYKPISLNQWLATLLLPPEMYAPERSLLVPFSGVSSEMIGGMFAGWDRIVGIEQSEEYCKIGRRRMDYYATQK